MNLADVVYWIKSLRDEVRRTRKVYHTSVAAALSLATTLDTDFPGKEWILKAVLVTFSSAPTTSENLTLTLNNPNINRPDAVLFSTNPSVGSATSVVNTWDNNELRMEAGQEVTLAFTNTDARTVRAEIIVEVLK